MALMILELADAADGNFLGAGLVEADAGERFLGVGFDGAERVLGGECIHKRISKCWIVLKI